MAGVAGQPHLGEDDEVRALRLGLFEQVERAVGVELAVGDPKLRATRPRRGGSRGGSYRKCICHLGLALAEFLLSSGPVLAASYSSANAARIGA